MQTHKTFLALAAALVVGGSLASCGGVPSDSVATVADDPILTSTFNDWMKIAAKQQGTVPAGQAVAPLTPPDFKECVAAKQAAAVKAKTKPTEAALKSQCQSEFDQGKQQVMQLLITTGWIRGQANLMGIKVSDSAIAKKFNETKKQAFQTDAAYQKFLKTSGQTEAQLKDRIKTDLQSQAIRDSVIKNAETVSDEEAAAYYNKNKDQFGTPEKRSYDVILAKTQAQAEAARKAIESGTPWAEVAKQYSTDSATKNKGGVVKDAIKGQNDPSLEKAIFDSNVNELSQPVKGSFGWYIVKVTGKTPGTATAFVKVKPQIVQQVKSQKQQAALTAFVKSFQDKWKAKTECAKYYIVDLCKNAPKQATQPGPGTTQQAPAPSQGG